LAEATSELQRRVRQLTPKERACLRLVAQRRSSKEIAAELGISKTSVDTYCDRARAKLCVADRFEAARILIAAQGPDIASVQTIAAPPGVIADRRERHRPVIAAAAAAATLLAFATLLAGLRALDDMRPTGFPADAALVRIAAAER
jgi:DNA-binding CsgD family transcriptional regulator